MVKTMRQNTQPEKQSLTPMQKQAVLVCIVCALAALLTIGITLVLIHRGKEPAASSEQPGTEQPADDANIADHYQINEQSSALLPETADAGDAYQSETLFIGDSNTVPPVPADHSNYPNMDQTRIDDFNMALLSMCEEMGLKFLNTAEALKDSTGYGNADYYQSGDIHLKTSGLKVLLNYLRTHA